MTQVQNEGKSITVRDRVKVQRPTPAYGWRHFKNQHMGCTANYPLCLLQNFTDKVVVH